MEDTIKGIPRWLRIGSIILIYAGLLMSGHWGGEWLTDLIAMDFGADAKSHEFRVMAVGLIFYALLLAIPFIPGMEMSLALLAVFGPKIAVTVYLATVAALALSYCIGRLMPLQLISSLFGSLGLRRARDLTQCLAPLQAGDRLNFLIDHAPKRIAPTLLKHPYLAVIVALNMPGNAVIGGGGGIGMLAGMIGIYTFPRFLASVALAALPIPLAILLMSDISLW